MKDNTLGTGLIRIADAARFLAVSRSKVYELMDARKLSYVKLGRSRRIPRQALIDLTRACLVPRDATPGV